MARSRNQDALSKRRLGGEPVPKDLAFLLAHADALAKRTGIELNWEKEWAPWSDTSYLSAADRANPDIMANVRAIADVCELIAFVAAHEDGEYYGYWRGPGKRPVAESPVVRLDNEGQFNLCAGSTFAEALLEQTFDEEQFGELRDWLRSLGVTVGAETQDDLASPKGKPSPDKMHKDLYYRYCREMGLGDQGAAP
jgi:hypothetical protein